MIIQKDIKEKKTVNFNELAGGDIFSYDYPPTNILMKLSTKETFLDEDENNVTAIYLENGSGSMAHVYDFVYPLTGKLVITG